MNAEEAIAMINAALNIQAAVTVIGDEVKCWCPATESAGVDKTYLGAIDCRGLSTAFAALADTLSGCEADR